MLSLLSEMAEERPLVCVVDDAQWLDGASAQALAFVARRLLAESVLMLFAAREPGADLDGLPELVVEGLRDAEARELLDSVVRWPLDERVRERFVAETQGNPLALLELPLGLSPAELAGGFGLPDALPVPGRIQESFGRRVEGLPEETRLLLAVAAAEPAGDPALVWRAAGRLGIPAHASLPAAEAGLVQFGARVRFRHPLARSAVYRSASPQDRHDVHRALAEATDPQVDPDRRAWHRAQAALGPDEKVATELERAAGRAQARGGLAAMSAFLERAADLTPDPAQRTERALTAAEAKVQAGAFGAALELLGRAEATPLNELQRARVDLLHAQLTFVSNRGRDAPPLLLSAARRLERIDADLARATYLDTVERRDVRRPSGQARRRRARGGPGSAGGSAGAAAAPAPDLLLDGLARHFSEGYAAGLPVLERALGAFGRETSAAEQLRWLWLASVTALHLWDDQKWDTLSSRHVELARGTGALSELPLALSSRAYMQLFAGELTAAASLTEEVQAATEVTGGNLAPYVALGLAAWHGREDEASALIEAARAEVSLRGEGIGITVIEWSNAVLYNGLGRYDEALAAAERGSRYPHELGLATWSMAELIEAAARTGQPGHAAGALRRLSETTSAAGTDWALGVEARSRALLSEGEAADHLYREAIEQLGRTRSARNWPARTCCTANGCGARTAAWTHASSSASPTRC